MSFGALDPNRDVRNNRKNFKSKRKRNCSKSSEERFKTLFWECSIFDGGSLRSGLIKIDNILLLSQNNLSKTSKKIIRGVTRIEGVIFT